MKITKSKIQDITVPGYYLDEENVEYVVFQGVAIEDICPFLITKSGLYVYKFNLDLAI